jgi:hypothetical protein
VKKEETISSPLSGRLGRGLEIINRKNSVGREKKMQI